MQIEYVPIADIKEYANNPRARSAKQRMHLTTSIQDYGFNAPVTIDENNEIINGRARFAALRDLGWETIPCIRVCGLSDAEKKAYRIADNEIGAMSHFVVEGLAIELDAIAKAGLKLETATAFETPRLDLILGQAREARGPDIDADAPLPVEPDMEPVSRSGDLWSLGAHRLLCGDARDAGAIARLMAGNWARMIFADGPYNLRINGFVIAPGRHEEFREASGEQTPDQFQAFNCAWISLAAQACMDGAVLFVCMDWRHVRELLAAADACGLRLLNLAVWVKTNGGMGSFYRSQHELVFVFKKGDAPHINNIELGKHGRSRTNVWQFRGANAFGPTREDDLASHPTLKPTALVAEAIKDVSQRGDIVLDPFSGSGTTILAAEQTGRRACALEIEPRYVDLAIRRFEKATGKQARHDETGRTFEEEAAHRKEASK